MYLQKLQVLNMASKEELETCLNSRNTECAQNYSADWIIVDHLHSPITIMSIKSLFNYVPK